jgi:hypothetical protein
MSRTGEPFGDRIRIESGDGRDHCGGGRVHAAFLVRLASGRGRAGTGGAVT